MRIINQDTHVKMSVKNKLTRPVVLFEGTKEFNKSTQNTEIIKVENQDRGLVRMANAQWKDSAAYFEHWNRIQNLSTKIREQVKNANNNTPSDLATLLQLYFMDITRRAMERIDFTGRLSNETTDYNAPETASPREFFPYRGKFGVINGADDSVNMIKQATGVLGSLTQEIMAIGWADTLHNMLFNSIHTLEKVFQCVADSWMLERNDRSIGLIFAKQIAGFDASQQVAASADADLTYEENLYMTFKAAFKKMMTLKDPQTNRIIARPSLALLIHSTRRWEAERVIRGQLETSGATDGRGNLYSPLPINEIWEYDGDAYDWGDERVTYSGCPTDRAFLFVPRYACYTLNKRPLVQEIGRGDVLKLSTEKRAWYSVQGTHYSEFFGSSDATLKAALAARFGGDGSGYGFVIEIELPSDTYET